MDSYQKFEDAIVEYWEAQGTSSVRRPYWSDAGEPLLEIPLLEKLLTVAVRDGSSAQSGSLAKALDMWVAEELRAAGFDAQSVWPRLAAAGFGSFGPAFHRLTGCANGGKMPRGPSSLCQRQRQRARVDLLQAGRCGAILLDDGS